MVRRGDKWHMLHVNDSDVLMLTSVNKVYSLRRQKMIKSIDYHKTSSIVLEMCRHHFAWPCSRDRRRSKTSTWTVRDCDYDRLQHRIPAG